MITQTYYVLVDSEVIISTNGQRGFSKHSALRNAETLRRAYPDSSFDVVQSVPLTNYILKGGPNE